MKEDKPSFIVHALHLFHRFLCSIIRFILTIVYGKHGNSVPTIDDPLLLESATAIADKIRTKQVTATQVIHTYIKRVKQVNPLVNCVVDERYKDALKEAADVDELIASNKYTVDELQKSKPFLGVPISTKDAIGVKGMIQSCGLWHRRDVRATGDSDAMHLMREAGAIPFVITNVPELCMWCESANKVYGRTLNPYDTNRIPGGSSGGEGCLQGAGGSPFGIGSDIGGSIRMPCFFNGIFGHIPSSFIVSKRGHFPPSYTKEKQFAGRIGPMSRFACDLKPMLKVLAGDKAKELSLDKPVNLSNLKYFYQLDGGGLFISKVDDDVRGGLEKVIEYLKTEIGASPTKVKVSKLKDSMSLWSANLLDEEKNEFERQLVNYNGQINPYLELLKSLVGLSKNTFVAILIAINSRMGVKYQSPEHQSKVRECEELQREFDEMLGDSGVFIYPTYPIVAPYHNEPIFMPSNFVYTGIFNVLGLPSTAVPLGLGKSGLPIGIQVLANRNQDRLCLAVASELERAFGGWTAPKTVA